MSATAAVHLTDGGNGIYTLTLDRPGRLNVINYESADALLACIAEVAASDTARVLILRGNGPAFCGGGDVAAMQAHRDTIVAFLGLLIDRFHAAVTALQQLALPVIASVQGAAAGGGFSLAMACDLVIATPTARFVIGYSKLGVSTDGGLTWFLTQRLGRCAALEALTLGGTWSAEQALDLGMINRIVAEEELEAESLAFAQRLLQLTPQSLREYKHLVAAQSGDALQAHLAREKESVLRCAAIPDFIARVDAFLAPKRGKRAD